MGVSVPDRQLMTFEAPRVEQGDDDVADLVCAPQPADTRARREAEGPRLGDGVFNMTSNASSAHHPSFVYGTVMDEGGELNRPLVTTELITSIMFTGSAADLRSRIQASRDPFVSEVAFQPGRPDTARELESSSRVVEGV